MFSFLIISAGLSFTVFRHPAVSQNKNMVATNGPMKKHRVNDGFDRILATGAALKRTLQLRAEVETITAKPKLNYADSLVLERALDSLGQLNHQINHVP